MSDSKSQDAVDFLHHVQEVESTNRAEGLEDLKFRFGDQWPAAMIDARGNRPKLTVNETDAYIRQITNAMREQRPRIKTYAANTSAQKKTADVITGVMRHIQYRSDADNAYDLAGEFAVTSGVGFLRVNYDYVREDSFDQDLSIDQVENPFSVYFDTNSNQPDGSDAEKCLITDNLPLATFQRDFPGADTAGFVQTGTGDMVTNDWITKDTVRIAEYFTVERVKAKLIHLSNDTAMYEDEINPALLAMLNRKGIGIKGDRESYKRKVMWRKVTAFQTLKEVAWAGRWIPVIPVYGAVMIVDGKKVRMGAVRFARDPQRMVNYWQTNITESMAMAPKAKWLMVEGQDEGHENEWNKANIDAMPMLRYKSVDIDGKPAPPPQRIAPDPPPEGLITASIAASQNLQRVMGMFDPDTNVRGPKSGRARDSEAQQAERSNYHFYDNLTRSMKHTGRIVLDLMKPVYHTANRVTAIIGDDGKTSIVTLNDDTAAADKVLNDVRVGEYGIIMDVGPGYNSKRKEAAEILGQILSQDKELMAQIGDLYFRNLDFPGSEVIADRLAANNPLAQIDEQSEIPPGAQMMIKALQEKLKQAQGMLQQAGMTIKYRQDIEEKRQEGETRREMLRQTTKAHDIEVSTATKRHDTETRALTAQNVEEIRGFVQLVLDHLDTRRFAAEMEHKDRELEAKSEQAEAAATPA